MSSRRYHISTARLIALSVLATAVAPAWADGSSATPLTFGLPNTINKVFTHETATGLYFGSSTTPLVEGSNATPGGVAAWIFDPVTLAYTPLGLSGPGFTNSAGLSSTTIINVLPDFVYGNSAIFSKTDSTLGDGEWLFDRSTGSTVRVGLTGADYTRSDGTQISNLYRQQDGLFLGTSTRYAGDISSQTVAWSYDPVSKTTTVLTPTDAAHVDPAGSYTLTAWISTTASTLAFSGARYSGSTQIGNDVLVTNIHGETPVNVGLFDSDHTRNDGYYYNGLYAALGDFVAGYTNRYNGATAIGQDAWLYDHAANTTTLVGLIDGAHTASDGSRMSDIRGMDESGDVAGGTYRYNGTTQTGVDAWYQAHGQAAVEIGLTDAAHTSSTGQQDNIVVGIAAPGLVSGTAYNFSGHGLVSDAWVYNDATHTTTQYGLSGGGNTQLYGVYANGFVIGDTHASANSGDRFWVYNPVSGKTSQVNLAGADYTDPNGQQHLFGGVQRNENGFVAAMSERSDLSADDAWLYSAASDTTYNFRYLGAPDGSIVTSLLNDGTVYGTYLHNGSQYAFSFSESGGFVDLSTLYQAQLAAIGANYLTGATMESDGTLVGSASVGTQPYETELLVLQPAPVPEPFSLAAFAGGAPLLLFRRRAQR
ncbi:MAG TPA: hypothetical protein VHQ47_14125 [Phycisphaerae bacterium]|nr:hypothetical protein [Phycisphaerae bacterium]